MIDFWGIGFDVAERMNHRPREICESLRANEERIRRRNSSTRSWESFLFSLPRGDLAEAIFNVVADKIETVFGDSITAIREDRTGVDVQFEHGHARKFDLLAGCDGLHSAVRELLWGRDKNFVKDPWVYCASFITTNYAHREEETRTSYAEPGRQISRYPSAAIAPHSSLFLRVSKCLSSIPTRKARKKYCEIHSEVIVG